jgi:hypothetical protein
MLAPAHIPELKAGRDLLDQWWDRLVLGDKAYITAPITEELQQMPRLTLLTCRARTNGSKSLPLGANL